MPTIKFAAWVHGNAAKAEFPTVASQIDGAGSHFLFNQQTIVSVPPAPPLAVFLGPRQGTNWFHFTPTTPVIVDGVRPKLARCFVLFNSTSARVTQVDLFDGMQRVAQIPNGGQIAGDVFDIANAFPFAPGAPLAINFGLGISVKVDFYFDTSTQQNSRIWFSAVGADFEIP